MQELFKEIYNKYYSELCIYARRFVLSDEEAEETVQEVITRMWEHRQKLDEISSLRAYLYKAVYNKSLNYINQLARENKYKDESLLELKKIELSLTEKILETELDEQIQKSIADLPDRCREVFELSRFEGLKNREIADRLGVSLKAVEANISRALISLRKTLKEYMGMELLIIATFFIDKM